MRRSDDRRQILPPFRLALVLVALAACTGDGSPSSGPDVSSTPPPAGWIVELGVQDARILRDVPVGPDPLIAAATRGAVWTANLDDSTVSRVDVDTGEVTDPGAGEVVGLASDGDDLWIATDGNRLARLDGTTGVIEQEIVLSDRPLFDPRNAGFVAVGAGSIWVTIPPGSGGRYELWRVDPRDGAIVARLAIGGDPFPPVATADAVWLVDADSESLLRVDARTQEVTTRQVGVFPGAIAVGDGRVWVSTAGAVVEVDPRTGRALGSFEVPGAARGMALADGRLWFATDVGVTVVDPDTGTIEGEVELASPSGDEGPIVVVPAGGSVWVTIETA